MHLTIIHDNTYITSIRTSQRTLFHTRHDTFQDSRHETRVNRTTYDTINKYQFTAPFQWDFFGTFHVHLKLLRTKLISIRQRHTFVIRFYNQMHLTKLACTTRLFLMAIVCTSRLRNGFTIRNSRFLIFDLQLFIILQTPFQRTQVEFTLSVNNSLAQFLGLLYHPSRIFLAHTVQYGHHLFCIGLIHGFDSTRIF